MRPYALLLILLFTGSGLRAAAPSAAEAAERGIELYRSGQWSDARRELFQARAEASGSEGWLAERIVGYLALTAARLGSDDASGALESFLKRYPSSPLTDRVQLALGNVRYEREVFAEAAEAYAAVDVRGLDRVEADEFRFKSGHALFALGRSNEAATRLREVDRRGDYAPHALYYLSYIAYAEQRYDEAYPGFEALSSEAAYARIAPFYLVQIDFLCGRYEAVAERIDAVIATATPVRRSELQRTAAATRFRMGQYDRALEYMEAYRAAGGAMGREEDYLRGYALYRLTRYAEAADALQRVCGPDDALTQNAAYHLADCALRGGDRQRAMQAFAMASSAEYDASIAEDALFNYGKLQYALGGGLFGEAIRILQRYVEHYPDSPRVAEARECLVAAYYNSKNYDAAYRAMQQIDDPDNNLRAARQKITYFRALEYDADGDADRALLLLGEAEANAASAKYTALAGFWQGEILFRRGDYTGAAQKFRTYLGRAPRTETEYPMALYDLGYCAFYADRKEEARTRFEQFLARYAARDAYRADAFNRLGDLCYADRDYAHAIAEYDKAVVLGGTAREYARYQRAVMLGLTDRVAAKIEALRSIVAEGKGRYVDRAYYELGRTFVSEERYADGARELEAFVAAWPRSEYRTQALLDLGLVYRNLDDNARAMACYKQVVAQAPRTTQAREALAGIRSLYVDGNDVDGYFAYAKTAGVETDAGAIERDSLSFAAAQRLYMTAGADRAAAALADYALRFPEGRYLPEVCFYLADCYTRQNDTGAALSTLETLVALPENDYTLRGVRRLARTAAEAGEPARAAVAYRRLLTLEPAPEERSEALLGYVRSTVARGEAAHTLAMSDSVALLDAWTTPVIRREAGYARATVLRQSGREEEALALYRQLGADPSTREGAESAFRVIEAVYRSGDTAETERLVYALADARTPHASWVARAFLVLGDVYRDKGDAYQARATYQSIVDGYGDANDGIAREARERIASLKQE